MIRSGFLSALAFTTSLVAVSPAQAARHNHNSQPPAQTCFDPSDRSDIRLWEGPAPGSVGNDPCRDIPFIRIFPAASSSAKQQPAILVIPGGGYDALTDKREQAPVGEYFSQQLHTTTFVLYYRLVQRDGTYRFPVPMWDGQRALKLIRYRAAQLGIDPARVGVFGFSAGGHLASTLALHAASDFQLSSHDAVDAMNGRPTFLGLGYPVISMDPAQFAPASSRAHLLFGYSGPALDTLQHHLSGQLNVTAHTPPVFLFESMDDQRISPQNSVLFAAALRSADTPAGIHLFAHGVHGAGLAVGIPDEQQWPLLFQQWLVQQRFLR